MVFSGEAEEPEDAFVAGRRRCSIATSGTASAARSAATTMRRAAPLTAFALSAAMQQAVALADKVEAGSCAIANSGSAIANTVTCNFGLTPEQLKQVTEAALKGATEPLTRQIFDISKTLGVTEDAAKNLLKIAGEDTNIPDDKLAEALSKAAGDYKRLQAIGEEGDEDMGLDALFVMMVDRPDRQVALQGLEGLLDGDELNVILP